MDGNGREDELTGKSYGYYRRETAFFENDQKKKAEGK